MFEIVFKEHQEKKTLVFGHILNGMEHIDHVVRRISEGLDPQRLYDKGPFIENLYNITELEFQRYGAALIGQINRLEDEKRNFILEVKDYNELVDRMDKEKLQFDKKCARDSEENRSLKEVIYGIAKDKMVSIDEPPSPEKSSLDSFERLSVKEAKTPGGAGPGQDSLDDKRANKKKGSTPGRTPKKKQSAINVETTPASKQSAAGLADQAD